MNLVIRKSDISALCIQISDGEGHSSRSFKATVTLREGQVGLRDFCGGQPPFPRGLTNLVLPREWYLA